MTDWVYLQKDHFCNISETDQVYLHDEQGKMNGEPGQVTSQWQTESISKKTTSVTSETDWAYLHDEQGKMNGEPG